MDIDKFKELVENTVSASLTEKEREKALRDLNAAVEESTAKILELSSVLEDKVSELEMASASLDEKEAELASKNGEIESIKTSLEEASSRVENLEAALSQKDKEVEELSQLNSVLEEKASSLENKFNDLEKEAALIARVEKLSADKVLRSGEAGEAQKLKVRDMSDEEFASYLADLKELREEFIKDVKPENMDSAGRLDFEGPDNSVVSKYEELGKALALRVKERLGR